MISSTGRNNRGFSLLELMVVVFIIGIISAVAALSIPSRSGASLLQTQRLALIASLRSARAEAVFSGRSFGLLWSGNSGHYYLLTADGWAPVTAGVLTREVALDDRVRSDISVSGQQIRLPVAGSENKDKIPQLLFLGDGQVSNFEWRLSTADADDDLIVDQRLKVDQ